MERRGGLRLDLVHRDEAHVDGHRERAILRLCARGERTDERDAGVTSHAIGEDRLGRDLEARDVRDLARAAVEPERRRIGVARAAEQDRVGERARRRLRGRVEDDLVRCIVRAHVLGVIGLLTLAIPEGEMLRELELRRELLFLGRHPQVERRHRADEPVRIRKRLRSVRPHAGGADERRVGLERRVLADAHEAAGRDAVPASGAALDAVALVGARDDGAKAEVTDLLRGVRGSCVDDGAHRGRGELRGLRDHDRRRLALDRRRCDRRCGRIRGAIALAGGDREKRHCAEDS